VCESHCCITVTAVTLTCAVLATYNEQVDTSTWVILVLLGIAMVAFQLIVDGTSFNAETAAETHTNGVTTFNIAGWVLLLMICALYMLARRSQLKLLRKVTSSYLIEVF
jgi:hypothetical protein